MIADSNGNLPRRAAGGAQARAMVLQDEPFGDLLAAISHEIRTPLTAVIGFCELMAHEIFGPVGDPRYAAYVRHIADGGAALLKSAEDTLALSALLADPERTLAPQQVPLADICHDVVSSVASLAAARHCELRVIGTSGLTASTDRRMFKQALVNLLIEALEAAERGSTITISATANSSVVAMGISVDMVGDEPNRPQRFGLMLARTLIELAGGRLDTASTDAPWEARVQIPAAAQRDLFATAG